MEPQYPAITQHAGWTIHHYTELPSTNDAARHAPPWTAIRADIQTHGRGRHGRTWVSQQGGLWISLVLPTPGERSQWALLPLAAGWNLIQICRQKAVPNLRIRWPNDIMIDQKKLAGILVERFHPDTSIVGLGINVNNLPAEADPTLRHSSASLSEYNLTDPDLLFHEILDQFHATLCRINENGWHWLQAEINKSWGNARTVECLLENETIRGEFLGIDPWGDLLVQSAGQTIKLSAPLVRLLRDLP